MNKKAGDPIRELADSFLPQNTDRPKSRLDFDLHAGACIYPVKCVTRYGPEWRTSRSNNVIGALMFAILVSALAYLLTWDFGIADAGFGAYVIFWIAIGILGLGSVACAAMVFYRRSLVVDGSAGEIRFFRRRKSPYFVLPIKEVRALEERSYQFVTGDDIYPSPEDHSFGTARVLVAELDDGRLAAIAFEPPGDMVDAVTGISEL